MYKHGMNKKNKKKNIYCSFFKRSVRFSVVCSNKFLIKKITRLESIRTKQKNATILTIDTIILQIDFKLYVLFFVYNFNLYFNLKLRHCLH